MRLSHALPLALIVFAATPAIGDRMDPPPPMTDKDKIRDLERRIKILERKLADAKQKIANSTPPPPPRPTRPTLDTTRHYRVPLDDSPAMGPSLAPITIVAAVQFPEPFTHRAWPTLMQILKENRDVRIVFKNFVVHPKHGRSSIATCAAGMQGDIDKMETAIYDAAQQPDPGAQQPAYGLREIADGEAREIARALRLNLKQYDRDISACEAAQQRDQKMFTVLGQGAVPVFWINGRPLSGAQPIDSFRSVFTEEREAWKKAKASGTRLADYYDRVTTEKPNPY